MTVMKEGLERSREIIYGDIDATDRSSMLNNPLLPLNGCASHRDLSPAKGQKEKAPVYNMDYFDKDFIAGYEYDQPATPLSAVGVMAASTGATASKYVARREKPMFIAENCTQCMKCIAACPDTAMPNAALDISTILGTAARNYVSDENDRKQLLDCLSEIESNTRSKMLEAVKKNESTSFKEIVREEVGALNNLSENTKKEFSQIIDKLPVAFTQAKPIFSSMEKKNPGDGGLFLIFISDLCKGCSECVTECGEHEALVMVPDNDEVTTEHNSAIAFLDLLPDTPQKYLGLYDNEAPQESKAAALRNHLMVRSHYDALVSGDGACAGCGEKSILHAIASCTEALMRPLYHSQANRFGSKAERLEK